MQKHLAFILFHFAGLFILGDEVPGPDPYIFFSKDQAERVEITSNGVEKAPLPVAQGMVEIKSPLTGRPLILPLHPPVPVTEEPAKPDQIAVFSDIHGNYDGFVNLLRRHHLVDQDLNWQFGKGMIIIVGDILDRGDRQNEVLWLLIELSRQAEAAGGAVHVLLGNHEMMVLGGDLRYVNDRYSEQAQAMGRRVDQLYGPDSFFGRYLRSRNTLLKVGDLLFVHGGIHPRLPEFELSLVELNQTIRPALDWSREQKRAQEPQAFLFGSNGVFWYRGYFIDPWKDEPSPTPETLGKTLTHFGCRKIIVGHTTEDHIRFALDGTVILVDAALKESPGEGMMIEGDTYQVLLPDGSLKPLKPSDSW